MSVSLRNSPLISVANLVWCDWEEEEEEKKMEEKQGQQIKKQLQKQEDRHFHVLAVDDSVIDRKILEKLLTVSSFQVTSVESGDKALEYLGLLDDSPPASSPEKGQGMNVNLIMTDYSMPGMSGYDLLLKLKGSSWKDVPVVVMSSENVPSRIHMCLEGGAEEFLLKPVKLSDMKKLQPYITRSSVGCDEDGGRLEGGELAMAGSLYKVGKESNSGDQETKND